MRTWIFFIILFAFKGVFCQENLVPNGGFEDYYAIPEGVLKSTDQIEKYIPKWKSPTNGSPDYFHRNSIDDFNHIPYQTFNHFILDKDGVCSNFLNDTSGNAFVGMGFAIVNSFGSIVHRNNEYIQTRLNKTLIKNRKYQLTFLNAKRNCSDTVLVLNSFGAYFSQDSIRQYYPNSLDYPNWTNFEKRYVAQYYIPIEKYNETNWAQNEYIFKAQGNENWLTIGNFNQERHYKFIINPDSSYEEFISYYFIDNISLIELPCLVGQDTACIDDEVTFYSTFPGPFAWWHQGQVISSDSVIQFTADSSGWYYLKTPHGEDSLFLTVVNNNIMATDLTTDFCEGEDTNISFNPTYRVLWEDGKTQNPRTFNESTEILATISDRYCSKKVNVSVREKPAPKADIPQKAFICPKDQESFLTLNLPQHYQYQWSDGLNLSNRTFSQAGVFTVTITDTNQCRTQSKLEIVASCKEEIWVPNAFAPNGVNTTFKPHLKYISSATLTIYNRWGEQIYSETSQSPSWDGMYKGSLCPMGVYFYRLEVALPHGKTEKLSGNIHLLR